MNPAQMAALQKGLNGFARTSRLTVDERNAGMTMHTVAGLIRSGHIVQINGIYRATSSGVDALEKH